jgi:hypothetical protein
MHDFVGITVLAAAENILGETVVTVFRVCVQDNVQDKINL